MTKTTNATRLFAKGNRIYFGEGGPELAVATKSDPLMRKHADGVATEIVRRWNAYPYLLAACEAALSELEALRGVDEGFPQGETAQALRSAIAKAKGGAA